MDSYIKKKEKLIIIILSILALVCLVLYLMGNVVDKQTVEVVYPSGGLSDRVFAYQNMEYTEVKGADRTYYYAGMPFSVDVPDGEDAKLDDVDFVYNNPYYFFYSTLDGTASLEDELLSPLVEVLAPEFSGDSVQWKCLLEETGYVNGCNATYTLGLLNESGGPVYSVAIYRLKMNETLYSTKEDMIVGCMMAGYSTETVSYVQALSYATVNTLQYDAERDVMLNGK